MSIRKKRKNRSASEGQKETDKKFGRRGKEIVEDQDHAGVGPMHNLTEMPANFNLCGDEKLIARGTNSFIVMGPDRNASFMGPSYGNQGAEGASAIDIFCGLGTWGLESKTQYYRNFKADAARIYISQKTDIDRYFDLNVNRRDGIPNSKGRSAVGIKADAVRIIGREGIKLVTKTERANSHGPPDGNIKTIPGIELIAGNDARMLEPIVKAEKLARCLGKTFDLIQSLITATKNHNKAMKKFAAKVATHSHVVAQLPAGAMSATPSGTLIAVWGKTLTAVKFHDNSMRNVHEHFEAHMRKTYLDNMGEHWIGSRYNKTN